MNTGMILIAFILALAFVLTSIIKFNLHPFLALLVGGIVMGVISGLNIAEVIAELAKGFGNTMASIGILIICGIILGNLLHESGCMEEIATLFINSLGEKNTNTAMNLTGFIVSIPVFFDAAFVILVNLAKSISQKGKIPFVSLVSALSVGLIITHAMVIPTPGPTAVAGTMDVNVGWFIFYGAIVALIGSIIGGVVYGKKLGKTDEFKNNFAQEFEIEEEVKNTGKRPSGGTGIALILMPIILILAGTVGGMFVEEGTGIATFFKVIGDKNFALIVSVFVSYFVLKDYLEKPLNEIVNESTLDAGSILAITGAGGSFGAIIGISNIGEVIVNSLGSLTDSSAMAGIIAASFLISVLLRVAQGSTTVALVTTSAIFAPIVAGLPSVSPILVGLAICAGGAGFSLPNDSGFWVVNRFTGFTVKQTLKAWTTAASVGSIACFIVIMIMSMLANVLPGLL